MANSEKILACGMSGRLPESDTLEEFWEHLINKESLTRGDSRRWDSEYLKLPERSGMLKDLSRFDASFFGLLPKQVNKTDPQLRILLEVAYEAITDAGFNPRELKGSKTGVYIASSYADASIVFCGDMHAKDGYGFMGSIPAFLSNRLSYCFDFKGPSYTLDAACASGLLVLQHAIKDILSGQCDYALVGAVTLLLRPQMTYTIHQSRVLSPDGICKTFDESADGFARAEAVVAVFLTRESLCRRAYGELIHAVINHSGFMPEGISHPSLDAQADLFRQAYSESGISNDEVEFIEAHGTGTMTGDPIEANAIHKVFCQYRTRDKPLLIGSVKSNMGHSECTAGLASLVKVLMAMNRGVIPPNIHFNDPKPSIIGLMDGSLKVVTEPTKYLGGPIAINSFGFGGVNVHAIVKPYTVTTQDIPCSIPKIIISSGRTKESVTENLKYVEGKMTDRLFHHLATQVADSPVESMPYRGYKIQMDANSVEYVTKASVVGDRPVWFIFTGMGSQWPGMGEDLMVIETFRKSIERCHKVLEAADPDIQLLDLIKNGTKEKISGTMNSFIAATSIQIALVNCLKDLGIHPDGIIGHSMGETAAAYADEAMSEEQTVMAIYWRARCVVTGNPPHGCMASIGLGWNQVKARLPTGVAAACQNAEDNITISGNAQAVKNFVSELESEGVFARLVNTNDIAFHSPDMFPIAPALQTALEKVITHQVPRSSSWISTSVPEDEVQTERGKWFNSSYLVNNLVSPVRFHDAVRKIPSNAVVIEIGPHGLLAALLKRSLHEESEYVSLMSRKEPDNLLYFLSNIGRLFTLGLLLDLKKLYPPIEYPLGTGIPMMSPGIKWDHSNEWVVPTCEDFITDRSVTSYKLDVGEGGQDSFIEDHNIDGRVLYPATGYIVLAWRAIAAVLKTVPEKLAVDFHDTEIHRATVISNSGNVSLKIRIEASSNLFFISENDDLIASGKYEIPEKPFIPTNQHLNLEFDSSDLCKGDFYKELRLIGYNYGPNFQGVQKSNLNGSEAVVEWKDNWITFLDTMLQVMVFGRDNPSRSLYLPTRIRCLRINPIFHTNKMKESVNKGGIPVSVDTVWGTCCSGGVEISGLHVTIAPKKEVKQIVTMESLEFVPYGKWNVSPQEDVLEYARICREYLHLVLGKLSLKNGTAVLDTQTSSALQEGEIDEKLASYLARDEFGYINVLHEIGKLTEGNAFCRDMLNIVDAHAFQLTHDKLLSYLPKSHAFKNLLDVAWENFTTTKMKVVEVGARLGGLFIHIVPCMLSHPLLEFELTATDPLLDELNNVFETELEKLSVKTDSLDVNNEINPDLKGKHLVAVRGLSQQSRSVEQSLKNIHSMLIEGGFLLLHEVTSNFDTNLDFYEIILKEKAHDSYNLTLEPCLNCEEWQEKIQDTGFEMIQEISDGMSSTLFLCRKRKQDVSGNKPTFVNVSGKEFDWVEDLKSELSNLQGQDDASNIWLISDNDYHSGIIGLVNCLRYEDGGDKIRCIFNASNKSDVSELSTHFLLTEKILKTDLVMNVFKNGSWGSYRYHTLTEEVFSMQPQQAYVNVLTRGDFSSLQWINLTATPESDDVSRIRCTVHYSSLNFRDVMVTSGKLPAGSLSDRISHRECLLGAEFAGLDPQGKRVMGIVEAQGLATHVVTEPRLLFDVPESWTLEEAATVPVVYSTVYYGLIVRGQLKREESVLIHSGSGGVGQAAIAVALSYGCKVFTTVGTEEKRKFLMERFPKLTDDCISNSRDTSFERHIMKHTNGVGVSLVLNSLSGEMFEASLRCLSPFGRFLEIGKYDLSQNKQIGSSIFLNNISFHGIHLDRLFGHEDWSTVSNLLKEGLRNGVVQPLPRTVFNRNEVENAFRYMSKGKHIGKVLIRVTPTEEADGRPNQLLSVKPRHSCHPDKVYLIIGGLGGFGLELANWLVSRGCKNLVITTRTGVKTGYQKRCILRWTSLGVKLQICTLDVSEYSECHKLIQHNLQMGPIGGIFNLAMVLKDGFIENLSPEDFQEACKPKLEAARNLDQATRELCGSELDWFVMFSSVSSGRGNEGQSNYGYGNSAMERICESRREDQLPALAIQWGVMGDVGVLADSKTGNDTVIIGCAAQTLDSSLSTLDLFLSYPKPVVTSLVKATKHEDRDKHNQKANITNFLSKFFGIDVSSVDPKTTLPDLGMDSLMSVDVKQTLERDYTLSLSMKQISSLTLLQLLNICDEQSQDQIESFNHEISVVDAPPSLPPISPILSYKTTDCLVRLNKGKDEKRPIFLFHPIEGSIDVFRPLAETLSDYPVFAFQFTKEVPSDSLSTIAKYYLSKMRSVQANGPYNLAGYSFGALLALEIAHYLQNDGDIQAKNKLVLLDASPRFATTRTLFVAEKKFAVSKSDVEALGPRATLEVQTMIYLVQLFTNTRFDEIKQILMEKPTYQERLDLAAQKILKVTTSANHEDMTFSVDSYVKRTLATVIYKPEYTWKMDMVLLKAKLCNPELLERVGSTDYGLSEICTGEVKVHNVEGDHETILQESRVQKIGDIMKDLF